MDINIDLGCSRVTYPDMTFSLSLCLEDTMASIVSSCFPNPYALVGSLSLKEQQDFRCRLTPCVQPLVAIGAKDANLEPGFIRATEPDMASLAAILGRSTDLLDHHCRLIAGGSSGFINIMAPMEAHISDTNLVTRGGPDSRHA